MVSFLLLGTTVIFGLRPPWEVRWLAPPLLPFVLTFWVGVSVFITRRFKKGRSNRDSAGLLAGVFLVLSASFIFTPF
ncbi:MAG: hypothetical protein ACE5GO_07020, partial [Anaerolineales bacterium]